MNFLRAILRWSLLAFCASSFALSQTKSSPSELQNSCRDFVQAFYNWYVPIATKDTEGPASDLAVRDKSSVFSRELLLALKEDSEVQAKAKSEIEGLDFDPFLNGQDPRPQYIVGNVRVNGDTCDVEIFGTSSGKKLPTPDVIPELISKEGRWLFVNFHYGKSTRTEDENLVSILRALHGNDHEGSK